ncbi:hypothetical protein GCWU000342_00157 [Shuttleworthella satelles DSM 14600]|uniref:Uncharacterized protein n=1 Tax=Shuttleworthella satelles DSM 14600 TaxID=626523 RepID=C4G7Z1_9FIRM|nr:hypothetical protein GCWU000342_00157 [Shuttleworthia satelles DSM 14600]
MRDPTWSVDGLYIGYKFQSTGPVRDPTISDAQGRFNSLISIHGSREGPDLRPS